jgi:hypothetical protein
MYVFLSKTLPPFVYPLGIAMLLVLLALFLHKRVRWQRLVLSLSLLVLLIFSNRWTATWLTHSLEWRYFTPPSSPQPACKPCNPLSLK